ncbi:MAG: GMC family oxidoreductase N-terminal domain-containing protein [Polyangiales bacterium]
MRPLPLEQDEADYVIIGTGAGGATAARVLSDAGHRVLMLEEGRWLREKPAALLESFSASMRSFATQSTAARLPIALLQGRCVGGSTAINSGIIWRLPEDVRQQWSAHYGLGELLRAAPLDAAFARIEAELQVGRTEAGVLGGNSALMQQASRALGLPGQRMQRNTPGCVGASRCLQGCPTGARQSMERSYVPQALRLGARLHTDVRAVRVLHDGRRATGVLGQRLGPGGRPVRRFVAQARLGVIVAAGAIQTPLLLLQSGLKRRVGWGFQAHPGCAVLGRFDHPVQMGQGATQGYEVPQRARGFKLESLALPTELLAARLPGWGRDWQARLDAMDHMAQWVVQVRMAARGRVRRLPGGAPLVHYSPQPADIAKAQSAVALLSEMMFAAGAREVYPGIGGLPEVLHAAGQVRQLKEARLKPHHFRLVASHLFSTATAGADPRCSVVDAGLEAHDLRRLYVMDASALPTNLGVNPQHSIMALVWRAAEQMA